MLRINVGTLEKKANDVSRNTEGLTFLIWHWVGREIIDEERVLTLPGTWGLRPRLLKLFHGKLAKKETNTRLSGGQERGPVVS